MSNPDLETLVAAIPELELSELRALEMSLQVAIRIRTQGQLSGEGAGGDAAGEEGPGLVDHARAILEDSAAFELTLADQALLAALVVGDGYQQETFSSRDINDVIEESGRPRVAHITSAVSGLTDRSYLTGTTKALSLSREGRARARSLIGMLRRRAAA